VVSHRCRQAFEDMRKGKFDESAATLRLKMDMTSANFNMWDQVGGPAL
jgi:glutamyl/glutaminyl-tRNA synthetase